MLVTFLCLAAVGFFACALAGWLPWSVMATDVPGHFALQYVLFSPLLLVLAWHFRAPPVFIALIAGGFALGLAQLWPYLPRPRPAADDLPGFRVLQINVYRGNDSTARLEALMDKENPDLIAVAEVNALFRALFERKRDIYPHQAYGRDIALVSRAPLLPLAVAPPDVARLQSLQFRVPWRGRLFHVMTFHTPTPFQGLAGREEQFDAAIEWITREKPEHLVVLGDINATPYCPGLRRLQDKAGLTNARAARGVAGTFPSWLPAALRINIDHVLVSQDVRVQDFRLGPPVDSDHLPTLSLLSFSPSPPRP